VALDLHSGAWVGEYICLCIFWILVKYLHTLIMFQLEGLDV
jgi:hypothetical protein